MTATPGTALLWLPIAAARQPQLSLLDAFFTATSAVCVTGLIVVDTPNDLSILLQGARFQITFTPPCREMFKPSS